MNLHIIIIIIGSVFSYVQVISVQTDFHLVPSVGLPIAHSSSNPSPSLHLILLSHGSMSVTDCSICSGLQKDFTSQIIHLSSSSMLSVNIHHCFNGFTQKDTNSSKKLSERHFTGSHDSLAHFKVKETFFISLYLARKKACRRAQFYKKVFLLVM